MQKSQLPELDIPQAGEFPDMVTSGGGKINTCKPVIDMFRVKREELCEHVNDILTAGEFYANAFIASSGSLGMI